MPEKAPPPIASLSFEAALKEFEAIVAELDRGDVELEQSIARYERGEALRAHCEAKLKAAELKVEQIVQGKDGAVTTEPASFE
ncbi:MAG: exodeoxyribonuclease VII small subunit [Pseudomonadota bacterium]